MPGINTDLMFQRMTLDLVVMLIALALLASSLWLIYRSSRDIRERDRLIAEQRGEINLLHQQLTAARGDRED